MPIEHTRVQSPILEDFTMERRIEYVKMSSPFPCFVVFGDFLMLQRNPLLSVDSHSRSSSLVNQHFHNCSSKSTFAYLTSKLRYLVVYLPISFFQICVFPLLSCNILCYSISFVCHQFPPRTLYIFSTCGLLHKPKLLYTQ